MDENALRFQEFERQGWQEVADSYAGLTDGVTSGVADPLLDAAKVGRDTRVVDLATGPGWVARAAHARGAKVVGVDISQAMIDGARRRLPDVEFVLSPAEDLDLPDGQFDALVSAFGMPHFADHSAFVSEAARVLRPGGTLAFASWYPPAKNPFFAVAVGAISKHGTLDVDLPPGVDMFRWAEQSACDELLAGAGFGAGERRDVTLYFETDPAGAGIVEFMRKASVRTRALYEAQTDDAKAAISTGLSELLKPFESGGRCKVALEAFVVSAEKA